MKEPSRWLDMVKCQAACPVHTDACGYVTAIARGAYEDAYAIARANNPFVSVCGRVCGAPCEPACPRGLMDQPVPIRALKRFVTERHGVESGGFRSQRVSPWLEKVAIVGAGVAGLTAAHDLIQQGYAVTVFEGNPRPGGMLAYGVPIFRLERELVELEIQSILDMGVEMKVSSRLGRDFTVADLRRTGYKAILLGIGLSRGRKVPIPGAELEGVSDALSFLHAFNTGSAAKVGRRVLVIGGGNVALDVARCARRLGQPQVAVVCLESPKEMPAAPAEVRDALDEGIQLFTGRGPKAIERRDPGLVLHAMRCTAVFNTRGEFDPRFDRSDLVDFEAETIVFAVGQAADLSVLNPEDGIETQKGLIQVDPETGQTAVPDVFAAGDITQGSRLFVHAIAAGQAAARGIHQFLRNGQKRHETRIRWRPSTFRMNHGLNTRRMDPVCIPPAIRVHSTEMIEGNYSEREAREQADRCLRCNVNTIFDTNACMACNNCVQICPENLIHIVPASLTQPDIVGLIPPRDDEMPPLALLKDERTCIRCGLCADACPTRAITMREFRVIETLVH